MTNLDLNFTIKNLYGEDLTENGNPLKANTLIANWLSYHDKAIIDPMTDFEISMKLIKTGIVELSTSHIDTIINFINNIQVANIIKAQILTYLKDAQRT